MKYKSITIENFRGISHLELTDLKDFNLIVGRNNCGKTSVLEAMFLLSGMANPGLIASVNGTRGMVPMTSDNFSSLFKSLDTNTIIHFTGKIDEETYERNLVITPFFGIYTSSNIEDSIDEQHINFPVTTNAFSIEGIKFVFVTHKDRRYECVYSLKDGKMRIPHNYKELLICAYLNLNYVNNVNTIGKIESLVVNKKLSPIITVLKTIDPSIQGITIGSKTIYVDIGTERLIPINAMGDGMRRILDLLASIAATENGVLLIDEIENGLHYSSLEILWKAVFAACKEYNVQIIATTHSYECVENFSKTYDSLKQGDDNIRLFRIGKDGEKHKAYSYSAEVLKAGIEKEFEVR